MTQWLHGLPQVEYPYIYISQNRRSTSSKYDFRLAEKRLDLSVGAIVYVFGKIAVIKNIETEEKKSGRFITRVKIHLFEGGSRFARPCDISYPLNEKHFAPGMYEKALEIAKKLLAMPQE